MTRPLRLSVIVPFHGDLAALARCRAAIAASPAAHELIVVSDAKRLGPAAARNRGAAMARGDVLVFIDADVVVSAGTLERLATILTERPELSAVFGTYDDDPGDRAFVSQYKNLAHAYVHRSSAGPADTFWAGLGAVRRDAFRDVGGFDERFGRPSVEDIDLGYRLDAAGHTVWLDPSLTGCHLKRWTLASMIASDIRDRGIPWTQLMLRHGARGRSLNVTNEYRFCVAMIWLAAGAALAAVRQPLFLLAALLGVAAAGWTCRGLYAFLYRRRGVWFASRAFLLHTLHHFYNGVSFAAGVGLYAVSTLRTSAGFRPRRRFAPAPASAARAPSPAEDPRRQSAAAVPQA